jgi:spermidine synthase
LPRETSIKTHNQDARLFLNENTKGRYDIVIGDVFNDLTTPYHLTTLEFDKQVKASMTEGGIYLVNIIDNYNNGKYMPAFVNTLKQVFNHVYLFYSLENFENAPSSTFVIASTDRAIDLKDFRGFIPKSGKYLGPIYAQDENKLVSYLAERQPILLTDDYAPTDILIAPVFRLRAERK